MGSDGQPGLGLGPASASLQLCHLGPDRGLVRSSCPVGPRQGLEGLEDSIWHKLCGRQLPSAPLTLLLLHLWAGIQGLCFQSSNPGAPQWGGAAGALSPAFCSGQRRLSVTPSPWI